MLASIKNAAGKLIGLGLILIFLVLGVLGILLPILPGLLFLIIAALIAAHHFPALAFVLKQNHYSRSALRISNGFMGLSTWDKIRLCFWGTIKVTMDGFVWIVVFLKKLVHKLLG